MCYSNSSTTTTYQLSEKYKRKAPSVKDPGPLFFASGFSFPDWRVITEDDEIQIMKWGLIPHWFRGDNWKEIASKTLNARSETADEKPSFEEAMQHRCIVPSTGFFEWKTIGKEKIPYFIQPSRDEVFHMAGIFDAWRDPNNRALTRTFSILTCEANPLMAEIHNTKHRMPSILLKDQIEDWLSGEMDVHTLEKGVESAEMKAHEISRKIISGSHPNCPEVLLPFNNGIGLQGSLW
jgi:putative SOS response-associated peptidase YedK